MSDTAGDDINTTAAAAHNILVTTPGAVSPKKRHCSQAVAFGRTYFHALGGTAKSTIAITSRQDRNSTERASETHTVYTWDEPPWRAADESQNDNDEVQQVECTSQSTLFLTRGGKIYQTGTIHGRVAKLPMLVTIPLPLKCVQVAAGRHFCLGRMEGGLAVVSWGAGHFGQLGVGSNESQGSTTDSQITFTPHPVIIERLLPHMIGSPCRQVAAGDWHALALTESGRVWAWGSNRSYQCGRKPTIKSSTSQAPTLTAPLPVPLDAEAMQISAGRSHSVALTTSGQVYCWGASNHGQCGNFVRRSGVVPPKKVDGLADLTVAQVAAGGNHTMALTTGGRVFVWGSGSEGELGLGVSVASQCTPRLVGDLDFVAIAAGQEWKSQQKQTSSAIASTSLNNNNNNNNNNVYESSRRALSEIPKITSIFAGPSYSAAISSSGHVYSWGSNDAGQMGIQVPESSLRLVDNIGPTSSQKTSTNRGLHVCTFDSRHNVLLPTRIEAARSLYIREVACGPNHMWCIGQERTDEQQAMLVGRTLYEVQEDLRMQKLHRARESLLSKVHYHAQWDDRNATTEGTTQTDNTDPQEESFFEYSESTTTGRSASPMILVPETTTPGSNSNSALLLSLDTATPAREYDVGETDLDGTPTTTEPATPASFTTPSSETTTTQATPGTTENETAFPADRPVRRLSLFHSSSPNNAGRRKVFSIPSIPRMLRRFSLGARPTTITNNNDPGTTAAAAAAASAEGDPQPPSMEDAAITGRGTGRRTDKRMSM